MKWLDVSLKLPVRLRLLEWSPTFFSVFCLFELHKEIRSRFREKTGLSLTPSQPHPTSSFPTDHFKDASLLHLFFVRPWVHMRPFFCHYFIRFLISLFGASGRLLRHCDIPWASSLIQ